VSAWAPEHPLRRPLFWRSDDGFYLDWVGLCRGRGFPARLERVGDGGESAAASVGDAFVGELTDSFAFASRMARSPASRSPIGLLIFKLRIKRRRYGKRVDVIAAPKSPLANFVLRAGVVHVATNTEWDAKTVARPLAFSSFPLSVRRRRHPDMRGLDVMSASASAARLLADEGEESLVLDARLALAKFGHGNSQSCALSSPRPSINSRDRSRLR